MGFDVVTGMYGFRCHTVAYPILGSMLHGVACRPCVFFFKGRGKIGSFSIFQNEECDFYPKATPLMHFLMIGNACEFFYLAKK